MRTAVARHYEVHSEGPRLTRSRVRWLEHDTTLHVLARHVARGASILELGAGHGVYALRYAREGHRVLATDIVEANVVAMRERIAREGLATAEARRLDAIDLGTLDDLRFGAVLCLGPYYHLRTRALRERCLRECWRVVDDGGVVAVSYVNRAFAASYLIALGAPPTPEQYATLLDPNATRDDWPDEWFSITHFATPEMVEAEVRACGFDVVEHVGTDGVYGFVPAVLESLDDAQFAAFRAYHLATCSTPTGRLASGHGLVVLRKA